MTLEELLGFAFKASIFLIAFKFGTAANAQSMFLLFERPSLLLRSLPWPDFNLDHHLSNLRGGTTIPGRGRFGGDMHRPCITANAGLFLPLGSGRLFAAQVGGIKGIHRGTIIGLSSFDAPLPDLVRLVAYSRWIHRAARGEKRTARPARKSLRWLEYVAGILDRAGREAAGSH